MPKLSLTILIVLLSGASMAQDNNRFTTYGVNEGLSQSSIDEIIQDKDGFLWIGTAGGLCRFDGYVFTVYKPSSTDPKAITSDRGFHFYNDRAGSLWIVSYNGISLYNELTNNFTNLFVYAPKNTITIENHFFGEDEKYVWIGLCSYGIVKVNKQTLAVEQTPLTVSSHRSTNSVWYNGFLDNDKLWVTDNNENDKCSFFLFDTRTGKKDTLPFPITHIINMNDSEAFGCNQKVGFLINKKKASFQTSSITQNGNELNLISITRGSPQEVLMCSSTQGLFYFDTHSAKITKHISITDPENKRSFLYARCAYKDNSGNLWVGSRSEGIQKLNYPYKKIKWYHSDSTSANNTFGIYADKDALYVGSQAHGLNVYSRSKGFIKNITLNKTISSVVNNGYTITPYGNDKLLIVDHSSHSSGNNMLLVYSRSTSKIELLGGEVPKAFTQYWGRGNLRHFLYRDRDSSYLTNIGEYLLKLTACKNNSLCNKIVNRFPGETLSNCFRDSYGTLWVSTYNGIYFQNTNSWQRVDLSKNVEVKTINQDPAGNIWLGTASEIFVLDKRPSVIHHYTEENGLVNSHLYGILRDDDGNMWFSHNKGLSVYRWKEKIFQHLSKDDGLQSSEFNAGAFFKSADGELFFGGINGVSSFYPRELLQNPHAPPVKITGIKLFDEPYKTDTAYWNIRKLELEYTENSISFEFAMPEYTNPLKNRYLFTMEGVDNKWIDAGDRRFTRYPGLRPGHYTFKVKGANNDGVFGSETTVAITIIPPLWQRTWFIVLAILFFILLSIGIGIFIQKIRQKKAMQALEVQHKIQLERERISRDLHDNVGTQLSLISKNIDGAINPLQNISDAERIKNLSLISQTSKEVIFTLRETIWALNKEEISLEELSDKLKSFTQKLFEINNSCRLLFTEEITDDTVVLSPSEAIHLFRICQEAITNSLKYANASIMDINISAVDGKYRISIADNGIGFDTSIDKPTAHYGLSNMKFRAEDINCEFSIDTTPGQGTRIMIARK